RTHEKGERFPLTIAEYDRQAGTIAIIFAQIGKSTQYLGTFQQGDEILDVVGPLGVASHFDKSIKKAAVVGGGLGCAIALPQAKHLKEMGVSVDMIAGFKTKDIIILEDKMTAACDHLYITTDDGSYGIHGFVTQALKDLIDSGIKYDIVVAIGPIPMMKFVSKLTKEYGIKTLVSMNPVMIDGTGMCGGCRLTVGGQTKFACIDGPDFDGHEVDFDEAMRRLSMYDGLKERSEDCRLIKQAEGK
ncbi:MAG: sulfide/dihydroorotate dehydrogenase-like FAD/NAD-binding protein, partial [Christensenellaceae bacterium]